MHCFKVNNIQNLYQYQAQRDLGNKMNCWNKLLKYTLSHKETIISLSNVSQTIKHHVWVNRSKNNILLRGNSCGKGLMKRPQFRFSVWTHLLFLQWYDRAVTSTSPLSLEGSDFLRLNPQNFLLLFVLYLQLLWERERRCLVNHSLLKKQE